MPTGAERRQNGSEVNISIEEFSTPRVPDEGHYLLHCDLSIGTKSNKLVNGLEVIYDAAVG